MTRVQLHRDVISFIKHEIVRFDNRNAGTLHALWHHNYNSKISFVTFNKLYAYASNNSNISNISNISNTTANYKISFRDAVLYWLFGDDDPAPSSSFSTSSHDSNKSNDAIAQLIIDCDASHHHHHHHHHHSDGA